MSAQLLDQFILQNETYVLLVWSKHPIFSPKDFGIEPRQVSTALCRGHLCTYGFSGTDLLLKELYIRSQNDEYPIISGVVALSPGSSSEILSPSIATNLRLYHYKDLNLKLPYTGKILLGRDRVHNAFDVNYGGYDRYWKYRVLKSLTLENGTIVAAEDVSSVGKQIFQMISENREGSSDHYGFLEEAQLKEKAENWIDTPAWWITPCRRVILQSNE